MKSRLASLVPVFLAAGGCVDGDGPAPAAAVSEEIALVQAYTGAYNRHDVVGMMTHAADDIEWLSVDGSVVEVVTAGKTALAAELDDYFEGRPSTRSEIESISAFGPFGTAHERAFWTQDGEERSQASLAVYEVRDQRIIRVWYYPAVP